LREANSMRGKEGQGTKIRHDIERTTFRTPRGESEAANGQLRIYALLSRLGFPKSYQAKIILVAFLSTYVPLVGLGLYLLLSSPLSLRSALHLLALLLIAAFIGSATAHWALRGLLAPIRLTSHSIREYLDSKRVPDLPVSFTDEVGKLMAAVQYAVDNLDATIRSLEGLSGTDHLTGLHNRREKRLAEDVARVRRGGGVLTVGVVDVNRFKSINDTYGHQAGDVCIQHVAVVIRRNIRESDWLARWGGDEFVLALHDASPFAPTELALQRIVRDLKDSPVRVLQGEELVLTVTIGAIRYSGKDDVQDLLTKADEAMYEAKREGRSWILSR
jgi:diguanylate cyclase (GGDEF)-like protein